MNATPDPIPDAAWQALEIQRARRRKREIIFAIVGLFAGFVVLPISIFIVGQLLLGPYAGGESLGGFMRDFYSHLGQGAMRTWLIALSPYLAIWLVRLCFRPTLFARRPPHDPTPSAPAPPPEPPARREPFIST